MPALSPSCAAILVVVALIAATYLPVIQRLARFASTHRFITPLAWYGVGVLLGPVLGLADGRVMQAAMPALLLAAGWVAARAGSQLSRAEPSNGGRAVAALDSLAAWLLPAVALYAAERFLPARVAPAWEPQLPVLATLAAAMSLACGAERRFATLVAVCGLLAALLMLLPHDRILRMPHQVVWAAVGAITVGATAVLWRWLAHRASAPWGGAVAGLAIGTGTGLASGASSLVVCLLAAAALARRSRSGLQEVWGHLARSEAPAAALLWAAAGTQFGGPPNLVASTVLALVLWPLVRRATVPAAAAPDWTLGLVVVLSYVWSTRPADAPALVTAAAIALLLTEVPVPRRRRAQVRLTSGLASVEVSV